MKNILYLLAAVASLSTLVNTVCAQPFVLSDAVTNINGATFMVAGDLNGDGKPDLVSVSSGYGTFTVTTNAGNGIFVSNATYSVGISAQLHAAAIADINGDGKPDIILSSPGNSSVVIFTNAGGGIFVSNAAYSLGNAPDYIVAQDINGDGKPDIITANFSHGTLTILTNAGGTFRLADTGVVVNSSSFPNSFAVADINGDGKPDIIAGDVDDGLIEVLTNAGGGIFVSNAVYASGSFGDGPESVVAADFNNDGKIDIATANFDGSVTILTNAGNGILAMSQSFMTPGLGTP
ncbi:MAG TPA: VCBS repeat-containing protein, partial [Verrucomicrobiae bacterium]